MNWTDEQLDAVWNKAKGAKDYNNDYKLDPVEAMMYRHKRQDTNMAWEVDHIFPKEILDFFKIPIDKINNLDNLRAMQHSNNESKGISFPEYSYAKIWDEDMQKNVDESGNATVNDNTINKLRSLFEPLLGMTLEEAVEKYHRLHKN